MNRFTLAFFHSWLVVFAICPTARAEQVRPRDPGFRTDLGLQLSLGGHSCLAGGSGYAVCRASDSGWMTSYGLTGGVISRPWKHLSLGVDFGYLRLDDLHMREKNWVDYSVGPSLRAHLPVRLGKILLEPSLGVQAGYVHGRVHLPVSDREDIHNGLMFAFLVGIDFFFVPSFGVGLEARALRPIYSEVCFEWRGGRACRGVRDDDAVVYNEHTFDFEKRIATYPWKLFYGVHFIYYV